MSTPTTANGHPGSEQVRPSCVAAVQVLLGFLAQLVDAPEPTAAVLGALDGLVSVGSLMIGKPSSALSVQRRISIRFRSL